MNISPVNFNSFKSNYDAKIKKQYPNYRPNMNNNEVVAMASCEPGYTYPITAGRVRAEIRKLEILEQELKQKEAEEMKQQEEFEQWRDESDENKISTWGENYFYYNH